MKLQNWVLELWSNYETATDHLSPLSLTPSVPGDGKPPRERPNGPTRPWFHSKPHRPGSSSACHAPMVIWAAATTPAMRHAAQTASLLAVACLRRPPWPNRPPPGRCAPARSPQFALPLLAAYKTSLKPPRAWTGRPRHFPPTPASSAPRGAPTSTPPWSK